MAWRGAMTVDPVPVLRQRVREAMRSAFGDAAAAVDPAIHRSNHADYQADAALALARQVKRNPREVGEAIAERLPPDDLVAEAAVSGPGFVNLTLRADALDTRLSHMLADDRLGVPAAVAPETVVVDYSAPNIAKEMHVGHLRSTIIGDAIVRLLAFLGHHVIRQNHVGDWGTPFGMLIEHLRDEHLEGRTAGVSELVAFYQAARAPVDGDSAVADRARRRVVLLQGDDPETVALWRQLVDVSVEHFTALYETLGVTLRPDDVAGESRYNHALPAVVGDLERLGLAQPSEGAICVFPPGFSGRDGEPVPLMVRKQDGGYTYATTDLAALRHRVDTLGARRIVYVVGAPQAQHLAMVFDTARRAGWADESVRLDHVAFGSVLGRDKKMLKTRAGDSVRLADLLEEAIERATAVVEEKSPQLDAETRRRIARAVGIGAVKYADLSSDRIKDYLFDWDRMLALDGNTAPYLMYANTRIRSILRRGGTSEREAAAGAIRIDDPAERTLALALLELPGTIERTADTLRPHQLCGALHAIATAFMTFYERCPVLPAEEPTRTSRLALCALTARVLAQGLELLGIETPEQL
jgi:arginyl-tRNA synthetase